MAEVCDGVDTNCSGSADFAGEVNGDSDNYLACTGYVENGGGFTGGDDCDDAVTAINPGVIEVCDGVDTNCSGSADFAGEVNGDSDTFLACTGYVENGGGFTGGDDCNDAVGTIYPFAGDAVGGVDNDCDGLDCIAGAGGAGTAYDGSNGPYYTYCATSVAQSAAVTACEQTVGGISTRLAQTDGATDNDEIFALIVATSTTGTAWIGATDTTADDDFDWDAGAGNDGSGVDGTDATPDFVASTNGTIDCLTVSETGAWAETDCTTSPTGFVCEVP